MSNKADLVNMNQAAKRELNPKLRFPEFWDAGEWKEDELGRAALFINERMSLQQLTLSNYVSTENILPEYEGLITASKLPPSGSATRFKVNDILISNIRPYLKKVWFSNKAGGASNDVIVVRAKEKISAQYLSFILRNDVFIEYVMKGAKGVKMPRGDISLMKKYSLAYPSEPEEQQKIADCLSSITDRITAEIQKLDTLKVHKKGLMQQLFPAEGETLPKLRFPEFCDAPEWEIRPLGEIGDNLDSRRVPITGSDRIKGDIPYYGASGIVDYVEDFIFDEDLLCVSEDGANLVARTYPIAFSISGKTWVNNHAHVLKFTNRFTHAIIENYLNSISLENFLTGMAQPKLNRAKLDGIPIPLPNTEEQQKIADCLSSINELIAAQNQKIATLKVHKKGLMQQLFPALDEVMG